MPDLSRRGHEAPPSPIRKLAPLAQAARTRGVHVYHVNIGQPDLPTPEPMRRAVAQHSEHVLAYAPSQGEESCRQAIERYYARTLARSLDGDDILVTTGGSEAILFALSACLDPGEAVLVPEPLYPNYLGFAAMLGVRVAPIPCALEDGYHLPADLERFVEPDVRAILFANPGNPTGTVYRSEELHRIAELALTHDLHVIADEVYREFVFSGTTTSVLDLEELGDRAVVVDSLSKRYSACGIRVGALVSRDRAILESCGRLAMARLSAPILGQVAAAATIDIDDSYFREVRDIYRRRRDAVVAALRAIDGADCPEPEGAFYTMARLPVDDADDFARFLLTSFEYRGATTMLAPGSGFYKTPGGGQNEVRIAFVLEESAMAKAIDVVAAGLTAYRERVPADVAAAPTPSHTPSKT